MVKAGYKETDIGVIPIEWELCSIERDFDYYPNNTYARDCMNDASGAVRNIHYGDVLIKYGAILDCATDRIPFINLGIPVNTANRTVQSGDIIMADTAEDETVGKAVEVTNVGSKKIVSGLHTYFLRPHADLFAPRYLGYFINSTVYHNQLLPHIVGTKVSSISKKGLNETIVLRPPLPEQRRIAEALSDVDALIANLEKLIAKKKAIKQGTMQLLLTGKKRLPGFSGEWVEKSLDDFGTFKSGNGFPLIYQGGSYGYPFYKVSDFSNAGNERMMKKANNYVTSSVADTLNCNIMPHGSIIFAKIGAAIFLERKRMVMADCCIDNNMMAYIVDDMCGNAEYLCYLMQSICFGELANATALPSLSSKAIGKVTRLFPPTKDEQVAIACILSDMDNEIAELEKKLSKYRNIKTGMMQTLLTGKIRLTEQAAVVPLPKADIQPKLAAKPHNQQFDDAVAIAAIMDAFYSGKYPLGRKKVQKLLYLLRRRQDVSTAAFKKKAAGPYADEVRYKGGEPIATRNGYITVNKSNQGSMFSKGKSIQKALEYVAKWEMQPDVDWLVAQFLHTPVNQLELLAPIDMAMCDLESRGITASVDSVKKLIASDKEWRAKLKKTYFSDDDIGWAITECLGLFNSTGR